MRRSLLATVILALMLGAALAGCLSEKKDPAKGPVREARSNVQLVAESVTKGLERLAALRAEPARMQANITINVVLVGLDPALVDGPSIVSALPKDFSPDVAYSPVRDGAWRSGLMHNLDYAFHVAPEAFADGLFSHYPSIARQVDIPQGAGGSPGFLDRYDAMYELGRAGSGKVWLVDALQAEAWIAEHRAEHGLEFPEPEATLFFLDSWSKHRLWADSYYWYEFTNDTLGGPETRNLRAFGGTGDTDLFFMDYSAAPNDAGDENSGLNTIPVGGGISAGAPAPEGSAYNDPPIWHYEGDTATIGKGPLERQVTLGGRIAYALDVAVNLRVIGDYAFRPAYKETYFVNIHLWHDGRSIYPKEDLDELLSLDRLIRGLAAEIPWANVTGQYKAYVAPDDDPGMDMALNTAKAHGAGTYIPTPPVTNYIDANWEKYRGGGRDAMDVMGLLFILEGHYTFALPVVVGGVAFGSADGTGWGTITNYNDRAFISGGMDPSRAEGFFIGVNGHEVGHFFGLSHAHDGSRRTASGYEAYLDHTWSSTNTVMSYRLLPETSDHFHREILARAHALENLEMTLRNVHSAYRALDAAGVVLPPVAMARQLQAATESYNTARDLFEDGRFIDAVYAAIDARRISERTMEAAGAAQRDVVVEAWRTEGVSSAGAKWSAVTLQPAVVPTGVMRDYRPVLITDDVEYVTVRATWDNSPTSFCDCFVGWQQEGAVAVNTGPVPLGELVSLGGGIHDEVAEDPTTGTVTRQFTLDMNYFPVFREQQVTLLMGAGAQGAAANGAYDVEIVVTYRDHGDGTLPDAAAGGSEGEPVWGPLLTPSEAPDAAEVRRAAHTHPQ